MGSDSLSSAGGVAAVMASATLLVGLIGLTTRSARLRPWLATLFGINAASGEVSRDALRTINPIDILLLVLAGAAFIGFWPGPGTSQVPWMVLAIVLPFAGIAVLFATHLWGRSGLMGGAFALSILMLIGHGWAEVGSLGIVASVLLLVGDFGTTGRRSALIATIVATGYMSLVSWFVWIGARLLSMQH